jgi:hypothetical protein
MMQPKRDPYRGVAIHEAHMKFNGVPKPFATALSRFSGIIV